MLSMNYFMTIIQIQCVHSIWTLLNTWLRLGTGSCACKTDLPSQTQLFIPEHSGPFISTLCYFQTYGIQINVWVWMVGCFLSTFFVVWIFFFFKKIHSLKSDWLDLLREMSLYFRKTEIHTFTIYLLFPWWIVFILNNTISVTILLLFDRPSWKKVNR